MTNLFEPLSRIKVVLIETSHPGNIGAVARAMKNMGLSQLVLVKPKQFPCHEATARASGAADILANAKVVDSLEQAVSDCKIVVGASARLRKVAWPQLDVRQTASLVLEKYEQGVALVFGREDSGLKNEEMDKCHYLAHIPTNEEYSSLNLAAAVQLFAYECRMACKPENPTSSGYQDQLANSEQMEMFYEHLQVTLEEIEFLEMAKNTRFMRRMRRLFNRSEMDVREVDILRGIFTAAQKQARKVKDKFDV